VIATSLARLDVELIRNNRWGRLKSPVVIDTGITGFDVFIDEPTLRFHLMRDGLLWVDAETEWNFGSGPAVNTPEMVRASLPHDLFCIMTDRGLLPWSVRAQADKLFRTHVKELSPKRPWYNPFRYWYNIRYAGVWVYSNGVARWKAEPYLEA
jgi:hypothetical protein